VKPMQMTIAAGAALAVAAVAVALLAPAASAQKAEAEAKTPANWSYEIRNGRRVPRGNRVTAADGSWREEIRDGACVTTRTMSAAGEYRETRQCD
jgi:Flp pilus assembly protein CpaB